VSFEITVKPVYNDHLPTASLHSGTVPGDLQLPGSVTECKEIPIEDTTVLSLTPNAGLVI
jgi:hypothetical protein